MGAVERLLSHQPGNVQVITRFSLAEFANWVSDVAALQRLLDADASVRGVRNLHAKLYLFGESRAIITSCNLTEAALNRNHKFGMVAVDAAIVAKCLTYFDCLWKRAGDNLLRDQTDVWDKTVTDNWLGGGHPIETIGLGDIGVDAGVAEPPQAQIPTVIADASQPFVKFLDGGRRS